MKKHIRQFFYLLDAKAKKAIPFLIASFLLSSILDVLGVGLIGIFLGLLADPNLILKYPFVGNYIAAVSKIKLLVLFGLFLVTALAIKAFAVLFIQKKLVLFCQSLAVRLKTRLMYAFQHAPYIYHLQKNSNNLISCIQGNIDQYVGNVLMAMLYLISNFLIIFFIMALLVVLHPLPSLVLLVTFGLVGGTYDLYGRRKISELGRKLARSNGEISKHIRHALHGVLEVRVLGKENYFIEKLRNISLEHANSYGILTVRQLIPRYLIENMMSVFIVTLCLLGIAVGYQAADVIAMVGIFAAAGARLLPTFTQVIMNIGQIRGYFHNMDLVYSELVEIDKLNQHSLYAHFNSDQKSKLDFSKFELKNICYEYPQTNKAALKNIDILISKGQSIGLIGPSGAGKSTLINLILGFLEPQQGVILIDGNPIQSLRSWLNNFAYIPQSIFLLDDTIRRNIAFGVDNESIDEQKLWEAVRMAQLDQVVKNLPSGLDTLIGENGVRLSGGQRQRVALARAFYHERDIIIMDEATSSLDNETEKEIINTIKRLKGNKTLIVIAHRLTTVEHCDKLYRLDNGSISAFGTYQEVVG